MMTYDIILVPFPFTNLAVVKKRPCIILSAYKPRAHLEHYIIAMITCKLSSLSFPGDLEIKDLKEAGLPVPSIVRLSKIVTIDKSIIIKKLGKLAKLDQVKLKEEFKKLFKQLI